MFLILFLLLCKVHSILNANESQQPVWKSVKIMKKSLVALAIASSIVAIPAFAQQDNIASVNSPEIILVTGKKPDQTLNEVAGSISVTTQEQIERHLVTDMSQLFKYDPSIHITGGSGGAQNFVIRGMSGDRILMIKDGMRMNEGYGANGLNDIAGRGFIEMDTLKQVEVAKGAASSLYGADALGGIVVFTTKDPSDFLDNNDFYASIKAGYGSSNEQTSLGTILAFNTGEVGHLLSLTGRRGNEDQNFFETKPALDIDSTSIFYKSVLALNETQSLKFTADLWDQDVVGAVADALADPFRGLAMFGYIITKETKTNEKKNSAYKLSFHDKEQRSWSDEINLAIYSNKTRQQDAEYVNLDINAPMFHQVGIRDMWADYDYQQKTVGIISNVVKTLKTDSAKHTIGYGVDIERSTSSRDVYEYRTQNGEVTKDVNTDKFPKNDITRVGVFVNDSVDLNSAVTFIGGLRWDSYDMKPQNVAGNDVQFGDISKQQLSPNFGVIYSYSEMLSSYIQFAQGFKVPAYDLAFLNHDNSQYGYKVIPTDTLSPERSDSFEIGVRGHHGDLAFTAALFYNDYKDFINIKLVETQDRDKDGTDDLDIFQYHNIDQVTIKGAELNLTYFVDDAMTVYINTAYQDGKDRITGEYIRDISPLSGTLGLDYQQDNWGGDLLLRWSDDMRKVNDDAVKTSGYGAIDMSAYYRVSDALKINLAVTNLTDREYTDYSRISGTHKDGFSSDDANYRLSAGREFAVSIKYVF